VLHNTKLEKLHRDKHFSLLGSLISYEENESEVNITPGVIFTAFQNLGIKTIS
jgi:hypothetical protein